MESKGPSSYKIWLDKQSDETKELVKEKVRLCVRKHYEVNREKILLRKKLFNEKKKAEKAEKLASCAKGNAPFALLESQFIIQVEN
jgi:hypothetical protein